MEKEWFKELKECSKALGIMKKTGSQIIVFDTETTGINPSEDYIIQLAATKCIVEEDTIIEKVKMNIYINPKMSLPKKIIQITGITDEFLKDKPYEEDIWPTIYRFFGSSAIVCGHNVMFDVRMLQSLYARHNCAFDAIMTIDTLNMARELYRKEKTGSHKLQDLVPYFGLDYNLTFHSAADDVVGTIRLLRLMLTDAEPKIQEQKEKEKNKIDTRILACWAYTGYRGMQRLYVRVAHERRVIWVNQRRPYEWGEKDKGSLAILNIPEIEKEVLRLYKVNNLEELSKVRYAVKGN